MTSRAGQDVAAATDDALDVQCDTAAGATETGEDANDVDADVDADTGEPATDTFDPAEKALLTPAARVISSEGVARYQMKCVLIWLEVLALERRRKGKQLLILSLICRASGSDALARQILIEHCSL